MGAFVCTKLFEGIDGGSALKVLRRRLSYLGIQDSELYKLHDFRRGHAQDLLEKGITLKTILLVGEWRSPAFMCYLDMSEVELRATMEAQWVDSSDDEE